MKRDANTDAVILHVVEGLVAAREDGSVGPMLADRWTVSPDGRTYRFHLREGVRFHNGAPLTAAAVVWSLNRYLAPDSRWRCKADLSQGGVAPVESVRADGRDMVEVRSEEQTSELQSLMRNSYAVFSLQKKTSKTIKQTPKT